jgi:hypothetical protein
MKLHIIKEDIINETNDMIICVNIYGPYVDCDDAEDALRDLGVFHQSDSIGKPINDHEVVYAYKVKGIKIKLTLITINSAEGCCYNGTLEPLTKTVCGAHPANVIVNHADENTKIDKIWTIQVSNTNGPNEYEGCWINHDDALKYFKELASEYIATNFDNDQFKVIIDHTGDNPFIAFCKNNTETVSSEVAKFELVEIDFSPILSFWEELMDMFKKDNEEE